MEFDRESVIKKLKHLTHHRDVFRGGMLEGGQLEKHIPLDNGRLAFSPRLSPSQEVLVMLPSELYTSILQQLDIQTLTALRLVNTRSRSTVDTHPYYKEIMHHAPSTIRALLALRIGHLHTLQDLYQKLITLPICATCSRFGFYLYLPTLSRACYPCLSTHRNFLPLTPRHAILTYGLSPSEVSKLPTALSLPGKYSNPPETRRIRLALVDHVAALQAGARIHGSVEDMGLYVEQQRQGKAAITRGGEASAPTTPDRVQRRLQGHMLATVRDAHGGNPLRFMCVVKFPWLNKSTKELEWGLSCIGCRDIVHTVGESSANQNWRWLYTVEGYLEHVQDCPQSMERLRELLSKTTDAKKKGKVIAPEINSHVLRDIGQGAAR